MEPPVNYCSACGHLSPPDWDQCHHCGEGFEGETVWSVSRLNGYYEALEAGYDSYLVLGYLSAIAFPVLSLLLLGAIASVSPDSPVLVGVLLAGGAGGWAGASLAVGSWMTLEQQLLLWEDDPTPLRSALNGLVFLLVVTVVLGVLGVIPVLNFLVGLAAFLYLVASPWLVYRAYRRFQIDRTAAVDGLLTGGIDDRQRRNTALSVLASTPEGGVAPAHRELLLEYLGGPLPQAFALVSSEPFAAAATATHQDAPATERQRLVDSVLELGERLRGEREYEKALDVVDAADRLRQEIGSVESGDGIEEHRRQTVAAIREDRTSALEGLLQRTQQAGDALVDVGELDRAVACFRTARLLAAELSVGVEAIVERRERLENEMAASQFEESADELFDLLRSAERAAEVGQYETAIERYRSVESRLTPFAPEGHEESYRDLTDRVERGLTTAGRERLLDLLPESPTEFERELLAAVLPEPIGARLDAIYEGTLEESRYPALLDEASLREAERAADLVERYRDARDTVEATTEPSHPHLERLEAITGSASRSPDEAVRAGELFATVLERLARLEADSPDDPLTEWADAARTALRTRSSLRAPSALKRARALVDSMATVEEYRRTFPSLSIDVIVDEMRERIEDGAAVDHAAFSTEFERIDRLVEQEIETLTNELEAFITEWQRHPGVDAREWRRAIETARESGDPDAVLEPYHRMKQMQGSMWSRDELYRFSWEAFEHLVANLYEQRGYETTVTSGSRDMGVDVWAENRSERIAIQVKQFGEGNTVGREVIQKLESTIARGDADRVVIVTSSSFATTAERYAANSSAVELVDGDDLVADLTRYDVPSSGLE